MITYDKEDAKRANLLLQKREQHTNQHISHEKTQKMTWEYHVH